MDGQHLLMHVMALLSCFPSTAVLMCACWCMTIQQLHAEQHLPTRVADLQPFAFAFTDGYLTTSHHLALGWFVLQNMQ
jgi:hypothetical protein